MAITTGFSHFNCVLMTNQCIFNAHAVVKIVITTTGTFFAKPVFGEIT